MSRMAMAPMTMVSMGCLVLERFAVAGVERAKNEEAEGHGDEDEVDHGGVGRWNHHAIGRRTGQ